MTSLPHNMRPGDQYWLLVEPIWSTASTFHDPERFNKEFAQEPVKARTLFAAHWCQSEVCNGGFWQFFYNSTGVLAPEAVHSFLSIGMPETGSVIKRAMEWFGEPYPRQRRARIQQLEAVEGKKQFRPLDDEFYRLLDSENGGFLKAADTYALVELD